MDVVLRTPTGEAELSVRPGQEDVPIGDLVERVTGRAPAQVVFVDGRAVPSTAALGTSGVLTGSVISTVDDTVVAPSDGRVELVQVAGEGAGARRWLSSGRYRIGMGRRLSGRELELAPVDEPMLELTVDDAGAVTARAVSAPARLDATPLSNESPTAWTSGLVAVGGRVFALGRRGPRGATTTGHRHAGVGVEGTAAFNRPPRAAAAPPAPPLDVPDDGSSRSARSTVAHLTSLAAQRHGDDVEQRRREHPDLAAAVTLADTVAPELWERRAGHPDAFQIPIGLADVEWVPSLGRSAAALPGVSQMIADLGPLPLVPVTVDLLAERGIGVVGGTEFTRSFARSLLIETAVTHGPADVDIVVVSSEDRANAWEWVKWLPHARRGGSARIYSTPEEVAGWAAAVRRAWSRPSRPAPPEHVTVVVVDEPGWWRERAAPLRPLFTDASMPLRFVALTSAAPDVPAVCTTVVAAQPDGRAAVDYLMDRRRIDGVFPFLAAEHVALGAARRLAPLDDPDVPIVPAPPLPESVPLLRLLGLEAPTAGDVIGRWSDTSRGRLLVTLGSSDRGPLIVDLVTDGPHALVAGAAGAGKSELVRTMLGGLAAGHPPEAVNFLLVDGGTGESFGPCTGLPHTVGVFGGLDEHLAARLVRCLRAELRHRADVIRGADASSFAELEDRDGAPALARLVLVVDEFALLSTAVPDVVPGLIEVAERGADLGVHLVLVTPRPAGAVDDRLRELMNVRVAMRMQDDGDSLDVVGIVDAAHFAQRHPGRGALRLGDGDVTLFQAATSSDRVGDGVPGASSAVDLVDVTPAVVARELTPMEQRLVRIAAERRRRPGGEATELERLVAAVADAAQGSGRTVPRQPCPAPLPSVVELDTFFTQHPGDGIPYALVDLPDEQRQEAAWWTPGAGGSMLVSGGAGAGTSSLLASLALGIAERYSPDDVHVYVIDTDDGALAPLDALPHVGAVAGLDAPERIARVVSAVVGLVERRYQLALDRTPASVAASEPSVALLVDNVETLRRLLDDRRDLHGVWDDLQRIIDEGDPLGICTVVTTSPDRAVPVAVDGSIPTHLVMDLGERFAYTALGFRPAEIPTFVPGRALRHQDRAELQLVAPPSDLTAAVQHRRSDAATERPVQRIDPLPAVVTVDEVLDAARATDRGIDVPVGIVARTGDVAICPVTFGETVFVAGPQGSGRSSILVAIARAAASTAPDVARFGVAPHEGPLRRIAGVDTPDRSSDVAAWVERVATTPGRRIVLIDDADRLGGPAFDRLAALRDEQLAVVVAGRADDLRVAGQWTKPLQRFRTGVLLQPGPADGDLVRVSLGARLPAFDAHRGILVVDGEQVPLVAAVVSDVGTAAAEAADR